MAGLEGAADFNVGQRVYIIPSSASSSSSSSSSVASQAILAQGGRLGGWAHIIEWKRYMSGNASIMRVSKKGSIDAEEGRFHGTEVVISMEFPGE